MKKILKTIVIIPNLTLMTLLSLYIIYRIYKETGMVEMEFFDSEDLATEDIKNHVKDYYPKSLQYFVAVMFYLWLIFRII